MQQLDCYIGLKWLAFLRLISIGACSQVFEGPCEPRKQVWRSAQQGPKKLMKTSWKFMKQFNSCSCCSLFDLLRAYHYRSQEARSGLHAKPFTPGHGCSLRAFVAL